MKKLVYCLATLLVVIAPLAAFAAEVSTHATSPDAPPKVEVVGPLSPPPPGILVGGDTFATATVVPSLPYGDSGNTCTFANDYTPTCATSSAPDVVYAFRPTATTCVNVSLCGSGYDTILWIVDGNTGLPVACNDDFCSLQSQLANVPLTGGVTYYIIVDGYSSACGDYVIDIQECPPPCSTTCPPDAVVEGEPDCGNGYIDAYNGGCNSTPAVFSSLLCNDLGVTICGRYGTYLSATGGNTRDTDWYEIYLDQAMVLDICACGQGTMQILVIDGSHGCPVTNADILASASTTTPNQEICINNLPLAAGTYWLWAGPAGFTGVACGSNYVVTVAGYNCPPVGVEQMLWGQIKTLFR